MNYYYGENLFHRRRFRKTVLLLFIVLIVCVAIAAAHIYKSGATLISESQATITEQQIDELPRISYDDPLFQLQLPSGWKLTRKEQKPFKAYTWQSTEKNVDDRNLSLYIDSIPDDISVHRIMPVTASGDGLKVGTVSERCSTLLGKDKLTAKQAQSLPNEKMEWQSIKFSCNVGSINRNVIASGSTDGFNKVLVTGPTSGTHAYFFVYTDHNHRDNVPIFADILSNFTAK